MLRSKRRASDGKALKIRIFGVQHRQLPQAKDAAAAEFSPSVAPPPCACYADTVPKKRWK
jgi:hypothetical protein